MQNHKGGSGMGGEKGPVDEILLLGQLAMWSTIINVWYKRGGQINRYTLGIEVKEALKFVIQLFWERNLSGNFTASIIAGEDESGDKFEIVINM